MVTNARLDPIVERQRQIAERQVVRFEQQYGKGALKFACHAAFPLTLTTDVVYLLRQAYFPELDWSIAGELLLSNLCDVAGYDLYVMSVAVRRVLLEKLVAYKEFGAQRVDELAEWMARYIQHRLESDPLGRAKVLGHPSHWTALACLKSDDEVTQRIKTELGKLLAQTNDPTERFRLSALMESQGDLLVQRGLEPLKLKELAERFANGQPLGGEDEVIAQVRAAMAHAGFPELKTAEIEYAKIVFPETVPQDEEKLEQFRFETVTVNARGQEIERTQYEAERYVETLPEELNLEMVAIPSGKFMMGSPESEHERYEDESPQHEVTVQPFFMGRYAITQAQWRIVAGLLQVERSLDPNPSHFKGDTRPVDQVSWLDAIEFCARLSVATGRDYRLPSEAEWEYACRVGTTTPFHFGETITGKIVNYASDEIYRNERKTEWRQETVPVGSFPPNRFGLYEMHGNVYEWCLDHWHSNYEDAPHDGSARFNEDAKNQASRVVRGGSWYSAPRLCRSAYRSIDSPDNRDFNIGFRVVCGVPRTLV